MKKIQKLTQEINELTVRIEQKYPELYRYLDENPITIPVDDEAKPTHKSFADYLESLKSILEKYMESHSK
ncbi:MAG TPA: hypothetical protein DCS66_13040 [Flavobacteriaceae bacterium]|jgi:hypothetical protein|nr:hypothetical protein [Aequorivita sp.]MAL59807.1 hypothetical protein [Flavobacteriaceae bacterium]MBV66090.1 hypothetical protein [Halomonas sp.]HAT65504.1 hypothetical protein [Flavobacteriaceae bacterium]HBC05720.1 hypothetical protein [Aequorivita sp.]|tara:strand:- start:693 stop:902 length:210 start_codon:yes stop_codon:yes gene_type:complete